jgi:hypothetical protein
LVSASDGAGARVWCGKSRVVAPDSGVSIAICGICGAGRGVVGVILTALAVVALAVVEHGRVDQDDAMPRRHLADVQVDVLIDGAEADATRAHLAWRWLHAPVARQDGGDPMSESRERGRQGADHVGQPAALGPGGGLRRDHQDVQFRALHNRRV